MLLTVNNNDAHLSLLARSGKAAPTALQAPGPARTHEIVSQGEGWSPPNRKSPINSNAVTSYKIEGRERPATDWMLISLAPHDSAS